MRRIAAIWAVCSLLLIGSFAVLMLVDRRAGIALPYSIPLAFAITLLVASAVFTLGQALFARRPLRQVAPVPVIEAPRPIPPTRRRRNPPEGVVLLDLSSLAIGGHRP